jgi:hypothetical protein
MDNLTIAAFAILEVMSIEYVFLFSLIPGAIAVIILIFLVKEVLISRTAPLHQIKVRYK